MRVLSSRVAILAIALCAAFGSARAINLLVNGGFEEPRIREEVLTFETGATDITGWSILAGSVDIVGSSYWRPFNGNQSLDLDGISAGTIEQALETVPGETYWLSFAYANNGGAIRPASARVEVLGDGHSSLATTISHFGSEPLEMNYSIFLESFVAGDWTSRLRFTSTDENLLFGIVLDAVCISTTPTIPIEDPPPPVPEPLTLVTMGCGLVCIGVQSLLRRRSSRCAGQSQPVA